MGIEGYLIVSALLFGLGVFGFMARRNAILMLISIELMFNAVNLSLVAFNAFLPPDANTGAVFALMIMNKLPQWYHPVFNWERFTRVSDDGFFLVIEARDPKFSETKTRTLLEEIGGSHVTLIHD